MGEVEGRKHILFGGHSSGVTNKRKRNERQHAVAALKVVSLTDRTVPEILKFVWLQEGAPVSLFHVRCYSFFMADLC